MRSKRTLLNLSDGRKRRLTLLAWLGFGTSVFVHFSTYLTSTYHAYFAGSFLLHIGIFFVFIPMVMSIPREQNNLTYIAKQLPRWAGILLLACGIYTFINWFSFINLSEGGGPSIIDGQYVLQNHGQIIREITETEYEQFNFTVYRMGWVILPFFGMGVSGIILVILI